MTRDSDRRATRLTTPPVRRPELGQWNGEAFTFATPENEREWRVQAYRQSVHPDRWQAEPAVDAQTQSLLDTMPQYAAGQFFRGPDGRHRRITPAQREDEAVQAIRRKAFKALADTGVTWEELGTYDDAWPHPGEQEAVALAQPKAPPPTLAPASVPAAAYPNKTRDMGTVPKPAKTLAGSPAALGLDPDEVRKQWGGNKLAPTEPPVLVAAKGRLGTIPGWLQPPALEPKPNLPAQFASGAQRRRAFIEAQISRAANDNRAKASAPISAALENGARSDGSAKPHMDADRLSVAEQEAASEAHIADTLFNWRRQGKQPPAASEYAAHAVGDEGRFAYLEDMKDEWSRLLDEHPRAVVQSMTDEVRKLSNAAQQDFVTGHHRQPNAAEIAEINDAVERIVFAPAERWSDASRNPGHPGREAPPKPYFAIVGEPSVTVDQAFAILEDVLINRPEAVNPDGKKGNEDSQRHVPMLAKKMVEELKRCGVEIKQPKFEKQIKIRSSNKGARWSDIRIEFEVDGTVYAIDINHAAYLKSRYERTKGEQMAFNDIVSFREFRLNSREFEDREGAVISFPKKQRKQTEAEYVEQMENFLKHLVDCNSRVKVRVTNPYDVAIVSRRPTPPAND